MFAFSNRDKTNTRRHGIPTKREYGRPYYSKEYLDRLRSTDLAGNDDYCTVEEVQQKYGLSSANIHHIVKLKNIVKIKVGVKNLLVRADVERVLEGHRAAMNRVGLHGYP